MWWPERLSNDELAMLSSLLCGTKKYNVCSDGGATWIRVTQSKRCCMQCSGPEERREVQLHFQVPIPNRLIASVETYLLVCLVQLTDSTDC